MQEDRQQAPPPKMDMASLVTHLQRFQAQLPSKAAQAAAKLAASISQEVGALATPSAPQEGAGTASAPAPAPTPQEAERPTAPAQPQPETDPLLEESMKMVETMRTREKRLMETRLNLEVRHARVSDLMRRVGSCVNVEA